MHFRTLVEKTPEITPAFRADVDNALLSLRSQREYKVRTARILGCILANELSLGPARQI